MVDGVDLLYTFARFLRHSVQALGVTTPKTRRRFEFCGWLMVLGAIPEAFEGVLEDWAEVGLRLPCDQASPTCDVEAPCGLCSALGCR
jgi:hypothetical protein